MNNHNQYLTLADLAEKLRYSKKSLQNQTVADPSDQRRGELRFRLGSLPLVRLGRQWLCRRTDLEAALTPAAPAPSVQGTPAKRGRPRNVAGVQA